MMSLMRGWKTYIEKLIPGGLLLLLLLAGCEKVIDVDLNEADPQVVVEGNLSHTDNEVTVRITKTGSYFNETPQQQKVSDAVVILENSSGEEFLIEEKGEGFYQTDLIVSQPGDEYKLKAEVDGTEYSAASTLNPAVSIDSLGFEYYREARFFEGGYRIILWFSDPAGVDNYYRIKVYKNGMLLNDVNDLIVFDDSGGLDGKIVQIRLRGQTFDPGDKALVKLISLDENAWKYFSTFRDVVNTNPGSPAPANPVSNFNNGALGYFSASSYDSKTIELAE